MTTNHEEEQLINDLLDAVQPTQWARTKELARLLAVKPEAAGQWAPTTFNEQGMRHVPYFSGSAELEELIDLLYECELIAPVDWVEWANAHDTLDAYDISAAPRTDLVRYVTSVVRADRFSEGTIAAYVKSGAFPQALLRLVDLAS